MTSVGTVAYTNDVYSIRNWNNTFEQIFLLDGHQALILKSKSSSSDTLDVHKAFHFYFIDFFFLFILIGNSKISLQKKKKKGTSFPFLLRFYHLWTILSGLSSKKKASKSYIQINKPKIWASRIHNHSQRSHISIKKHVQIYRRRWAPPSDADLLRFHFYFMGFINFFLKVSDSCLIITR